MPPSKSEKGAIFEMGLSNLTLFLSGGALHLARPVVDDQDVDRVLTRPGGRRATFLQLKTRTAPVKDGVLNLTFGPIADAASRQDLFLLAGELLPQSPWVGPRFALIPGPALPRPTPSGQVGIAIPLRPNSRSRWAPFVHDREQLATVLSAALDGGPAYPFPRRNSTSSLGPRAVGHLIETEVAMAVMFHAAGRVHLWFPAVDDFGEDLAVTDRTRAAALQIQPKGTLGLTREGTIDAKVRKSTFRPGDFDYLVFANFDPVALALTQWAFVIRADEFAEQAEAAGEFLRFKAKPDPAGQGPWRPWLYRVEEIAGVLETGLAVRKARGARASLPASRDEVAEARREFLGGRRSF